MNIDVRPSGLCCICKERPATERWSSEGIVAAVHGMIQWRCELCCLAEQIEHAEKMTALLPKLLARRDALLMQTKEKEE